MYKTNSQSNVHEIGSVVYSQDLGLFIAPVEISQEKMALDDTLGNLSNFFGLRTMLNTDLHNG
ncbi:hypothetical protein CHS0354_028684 [Potamilus streckersoni]|uniref:Uncharacterized protein n=1 Tax=Potamilus streckersoni TaxID=2493646 RepID=A0AAE0SXC3_9BIVA|nr:hypothetical protein CHS0354_028684 [Potamilus streckersoni]